MISHQTLKMLLKSFMACFDGLVQDCNNSSTLAMELLQSCAKPSVLSLSFQSPQHVPMWWMKVLWGTRQTADPVKTRHQSMDRKWLVPSRTSDMYGWTIAPSTSQNRNFFNSVLVSFSLCLNASMFAKQHQHISQSWCWILNAMINILHRNVLSTVEPNTSHFVDVEENNSVNSCSLRSQYLNISELIASVVTLC